MYTIETLKEINHSYDGFINQSIVDKVNKTIKIIESQQEQPKQGDIVNYTNYHGDNYKHARLSGSNMCPNHLSICESGTPPFISINEYNIIYTSQSGGSWGGCKPDALIRNGTEQASFCLWGDYARVNGSVYFMATVSVWEYTELRNWSEVCFDMGDKMTLQALQEIKKNKPRTLETFIRLFFNMFDGDRVFTISPMDDTHFEIMLFNRYQIYYYVDCKNKWHITDTKTNTEI